MTKRRRFVPGIEQTKTTKQVLTEQAKAGNHNAAVLLKWRGNKSADELAADRCAAVNNYRDAMGPRLAGHVSVKLGTTATFIRWDRDSKTGADVPVFSVPANKREQAIARYWVEEN